MLKEYLEQLVNENDHELSSLESQLNKLMSDLKCGEEWIETLQKQNSTDDSIFSPRKRDNDAEQKLMLAQDNLREIKLKIESIREKIEVAIEKKEEYNSLLLETEGNDSLPKFTTDDVKKFLSSIYSQIEVCLALLNSDKNRCKSELKNLKYKIKEYAEKIE